MRGPHLRFWDFDKEGCICMHLNSYATSESHSSVGKNTIVRGHQRHSPTIPLETDEIVMLPVKLADGILQHLQFLRIIWRNAGHLRDSIVNLLHDRVAATTGFMRAPSAVIFRGKEIDHE